MDLVTKWLGEAVLGSDLKIGEMFVLDDGATAWLGIKACTTEKSYALVFASFGERQSSVITLLPWDELVSDRPLRRLIGDFVAQPAEPKPSHIFSPVAGDEPRSGALGLLSGGKVVVHCALGDRQASFDLSSGIEVLKLDEPCIWNYGWSLAWIDGDEPVELCRFK